MYTCTWQGHSVISRSIDTITIAIGTPEQPIYYTLYRKAFTMQVQKDALTSAASFSCLQLVRHFQEEHFKRCSCVLFTKLLTPIAAPNTLNLERVFSLFPFCRGHYCFLGQSYLFSMLDPSFQNCDLHLRRAMVGMGWRFQLVVIAQTVLHLDEVVQWLKGKRQTVLHLDKMILLCTGSRKGDSKAILPWVNDKIGKLSHFKKKTYQTQFMQ